MWNGSSRDETLQLCMRLQPGRRWIMRRAVTGTLLGLTTVLVAWLPMQAQESNPPEPLKAAAPETKGVEEKPGKAEQETLNELLGRREKARRELQLLDVQLAVKRAEAQKADAEVQVFLLQHPDIFNSKAIEESDEAIEKAL